MRDPFFHNRAAEIAANILAAQCQDLGMVQIDPSPNGQVSAVLRGVNYTFAWDVTHQSVVLVHRYDPAQAIELEIAA